MKTTRIVLWALAAIMACLFGWLALSTVENRETLNEGPFGVPFALTDYNDKPITQDAFRGKPTALFFGFTHCPEVCPTTVYELSGWLKEIDPEKTGLQAYFISIDPSRDTPALLKTYLTSVTDRIIGISGDPDKVEAMARGFKIYFKRVPTDESKPDGDYTMDHSASIFLLDKQGRFVGTIAYGEDSDIAKQKLKNLMTR